MASQETTEGGLGLRDHLRQVSEFLRYLRLRFIADRCTRAAASLSYTSLLALVPLFTVVFVTVSAFPAFQGWRESSEGFLFKNFVPAVGDQVRMYLVQFTDKARGLQAAGITVLLLTVLLMMATVESTFNVIWGIKRKRPLVIRFLVYWSVLTLGPILIGASMVATSFVISLPLLAEVGISAYVKTRVITVFPLVATTTAFVIFFKLIPYRPVPLKHALVGGIVASIMFECAKHVFAFYVTKFPAQQMVYGAFATIPIFLIWIYLSWIIMLLGAEITQCLTTFQPVDAGRGMTVAKKNPFYCAYRIVWRLYQAQVEGSGLTEKELLRAEDNLGHEGVNAALSVLDDNFWICRNDNFQWVLTRDLHHVTLLDLLRLVPSFSRPGNVFPVAADETDLRAAKKLQELGDWADNSLGTPLAHLFSTPHERSVGQYGRSVTQGRTS